MTPPSRAQHKQCCYSFILTSTPLHSTPLHATPLQLHRPSNPPGIRTHLQTDTYHRQLQAPLTIPPTDALHLTTPHHTSHHLYHAPPPPPSYTTSRLHEDRSLPTHSMPANLTCKLVSLHNQQQQSDERTNASMIRLARSPHHTTPHSTRPKHAPPHLHTTGTALSVKWCGGLHWTGKLTLRIIHLLKIKQHTKLIR
ncbi:hypothetical protein TcWFU_003022 [Taenia crassiceps]|uniref:Uncharacterized protein n=1 Tax=Taenia crassiceps TaxID=6207 RepID=A0ABR4Q116_9CEST